MENFLVSDHFTNGLRKKARANTPYLDSCFGMRCTPFGLLAPRKREAQEVLENEPFPFPQLARLDKNIYHFGLDTVALEAEGNADEQPVYTQIAPMSVLGTATKNTAFAGPLVQHTVLTSGVYRLRVTLSATAGGVMVATHDGTEHTILVPMRFVELGEFEFYATLTAGHTLQLNGVEFVGTATVYASLLSEEEVEEGATQYEFATFGDVWFARNNKRLIIRAPMTRNLNGEWMLYGHQQSTLGIDSICAHSNMLLLGGFSPGDAHFATSDWEYIWKNWLEFNELELTHRDLAIGANTVMYSRRAGGDYWSPFEVELAALGIPGGGVAASALPFVLDAVRKKELGFFMVPTSGNIVSMRSNGDSVAIFCTDGMYTAALTEHGWVCQRSGDLIALAVAQDGPLDFLTKQKKLYRLSAGGLEQLAENVQLAALGSVIAFGWDAEEGERYIADDATTFLLTPTGLSKIDGVITSVLTADDELRSYESGASLTGAECSVVTETLDFGDRFLKVIHDVSARYVAVTSIYCRVQYRTTDNPAWRYSPWFLMREGGFTVPIVSGHDLRIEFKFYRSSYDAQFEYAILGWRASDKRNFRLHTGGF